MNTKTALVVDDSKSARFALRKYLENLGYRVDAVDGAIEAYDFLKNNRPRVIFLDHVMPGIDGFEALEHIKGDALTADIPVVICSSNDGPEFQSDARMRGALDVLQKPPRTDHLSRILDNLQETAAPIDTATAQELEAFDLAIDPPVIAETSAPAAAPTPVMPAAGVSVSIPQPTPSKVSVIREPEVAIEQAVMKALRGAMQSRSEPAPAAAAAPAVMSAPVSTAEFNPTATGSFNAAQLRGDSAAQLGALREQMESRMKKLTQDLFMQIAELKAGMSHLELRESGATIETVQQITDLSSAALHQRMDALENVVNARLTELGAQIEARLAEQLERISQITQAARNAAAEEAHAVSERTMMSAAARIGEQLAERILSGDLQQRTANE